jgi:hypothetical protein
MRPLDSEIGDRAGSEVRGSPTLDACREMLQYVKPDLRTTRVRIGEALKDEFGEEAFDLFDAWYASYHRYTAAESTRAWRSFGKGGGKPCTIGTVIYEATLGGFKPDTKHVQKRTPEERARAQEQKERHRAALAAEAAEEGARAAQRAVAIWNAADVEPTGHAYLERKGKSANFDASELLDAYFDVDHAARRRGLAVENKHAAALPYVLVVTVASGKGEPIYEAIRLKYRQLQPIQLRSRIRLET